MNFGEDLFFFFLETTCFWAEKRLEFPILAKKSVSISVKTFVFFFFLRLPVFGRKKRLNFRGFREISFQFSDKPCDSDSRNENSGQGRLHLSHSFKTAPPFPNPGYAPGYYNCCIIACNYHAHLFDKIFPISTIVAKDFLEKFASAASSDFKRTRPDCG